MNGTARVTVTQARLVASSRGLTRNNIPLSHESVPAAAGRVASLSVSRDCQSVPVTVPGPGPPGRGSLGKRCWIWTRKEHYPTRSRVPDSDDHWQKSLRLGVAGRGVMDSESDGHRVTARVPVTGLVT